MTKRETCEHADNVLINESVSVCRAPIPRSVINRDKAHVTDSVCDRCPCWKEKGTAVLEGRDDVS